MACEHLSTGGLMISGYTGVNPPSLVGKCLQEARIPEASRKRFLPDGGPVDLEVDADFRQAGDELRKSILPHNQDRLTDVSYP